MLRYIKKYGAQKLACNKIAFYCLELDPYCYTNLIFSLCFTCWLGFFRRACWVMCRRSTAAEFLPYFLWLDCSHISRELYNSFKINNFLDLPPNFITTLSPSCNIDLSNAVSTSLPFIIVIVLVSSHHTLPSKRLLQCWP